VLVKPLGVYMNQLLEFDRNKSNKKLQAAKKKKVTANPQNYENNEKGKLVHKASHQAAKTNPWLKALKLAREQLGVSGKVMPTKGSPLYICAMEILAELRRAP
jgi:hypothetical protein